MSELMKKLEPVSDTDEQPFGEYEEQAIISLALDIPEFFEQIGSYLTYKFFKKEHHQYVYAIIQDCFRKYGTIPSREMVLDIAKKDLKVEDNYQPIIDTIERKINYRDIPLIKKAILDWARSKAYGMLFSDDGYQSYLRKDYQKLEEIFDKAKKITDITDAGVRFFDNISLIFREDTRERLTTGFPNLDIFINRGGPCRKEVFIWMAPTGSGKTAFLTNSGRACVEKKLNVLHVTMEDTLDRIMERYMGAFTDEIIDDRFNNQQRIEEKLHKIRMSDNTGDLIIAEFGPDEISVDTLYHLIDIQKRHRNWKPDVLIVDYLELMLSRNPSDNQDDYIRQRQVATQLCGLAKKENVLVFTGTQTNRSGLNGGHKKDDDGLIGLDKGGESYAKFKPVDYVVSINLFNDDPNSMPIAQLWIAKNRHGPDKRAVRAKVNFKTMCIRADDFV
ncbi:MAG: DnaB-like helicase C-terminal domain-containing protein [Candidatus Nitrosocaldus sp.]